MGGGVCKVKEREGRREIYPLILMDVLIEREGCDV
jgi:hypothetical protein